MISSTLRIPLSNEHFSLRKHSHQWQDKNWQTTTSSEFLKHVESRILHSHKITCHNDRDDRCQQVTCVQRSINDCHPHTNLDSHVQTENRTDLLPSCLTYIRFIKRLNHTHLLHLGIIEHPQCLCRRVKMGCERSCCRTILLVTVTTSRRSICRQFCNI